MGRWQDRPARGDDGPAVMPQEVRRAAEDVLGGFLAAVHQKREFPFQADDGLPRRDGPAGGGGGEQVVGSLARRIQAGRGRGR